MAAFNVIPILSYINTKTKLIINGTTLPIYPHAYPFELTASILSSVVISVNIESYTIKDNE